MGFDQPISIVSSSPYSWMSKTPPIIPRQIPGLSSRKSTNGTSTLNRNFGSSIANNDRYLGGRDVRNLFNYPMEKNIRSTPNHFNANKNFSPIFERNGANGYTFGINSVNRRTICPTYNTVHPQRNYRLKLTNDTFYDATAEEYEDLDCYEKPPPENVFFNEAASPHYHSSPTARTEANSTPTTTTDTSDLILEKNIASSLPLPPRLPPQSCVSEKKFKRKLKEQEKKQGIKSKQGFSVQHRICLIVGLILLTAIVFALSSATVGYYLYTHNNNSNKSTLAIFADSSLRFFQQQKPETEQKLSKNLVDLGEEASDIQQHRATIIFDSAESSRFAPKKNLQLSSEQNESVDNMNLKDLKTTSSTSGLIETIDDSLIEPNHLLTLQITNRKICLFEVGGGEQEQSRRDFRTAHISGARLLLYSNLNHNGVPVHPLQFQRHIRAFGVDDDSHVIVYDRGQNVWATYAFWIFKLYNHIKISLLHGGLEAWSELVNTTMSTQNISTAAAYYSIESGSATLLERPGNFRASWNPDVIVTFDDVLSSFDTNAKQNIVIVDTQTTEEFNGKSRNKPIDIIYGHIRNAINIPIETLYNFKNNTWIPMTKQLEILQKAIDDKNRQIIVYDGTSLRSAMVWFALHRLRYTKASIYFGSWPEWIIRAPDYLKIIPNRE